MTLNEALEAKLEAATAVTAIAGTRIYMVLPPKGAQIPLVTIRLVSQERIPDSDGYIDRPIYDVGGWSATDSQADALLEAVTTALEGKTIGANAPNVGSITRINKRMEVMDTGDGQFLIGHVGTFELNLGGSL